MTHKILKCIPSLLSHGAVTQAANMINVVKASFEISQAYKEEVCVLPPHFITLMYDLYKDAMYAVSESAMMGHDKDLAIINAEQYFMEKSDKATSVLSNKAQVLEALRKAMSEMYDKTIADKAKEEQPSVLEKSLEEPSVSAKVVASSESKTIKDMIEYIKLLKPEERLAMIYALGIKNYVNVNTLTTASVVANEEAFAPAEDLEISSQELEDSINEKVEVDSDKFGIYSVSEIKEKLNEAMMSHQFVDEKEIEHDVLYTVVENISDKTIGDIQKEVKEKLGLDESPSINDLDGLLDYLDEAGEKLTEVVAMPAHMIFIIKDDGICMAGAFSAEEVAKLLPATAEIMISRDYLGKLRQSIISIKDEMESLSDELEDLNMNQENNPTVELARKISFDMKNLYNKFNADSKDIDIVEGTKATVKSVDKQYEIAKRLQAYLDESPSLHIAISRDLIEEIAEHLKNGVSAAVDPKWQENWLKNAPEEEGEEEEVEPSTNEETILQVIDENFDELQGLGTNDARLKWFKSNGDSIPSEEIKKVLDDTWKR